MSFARVPDPNLLKTGSGPTGEGSYSFSSCGPTATKGTADGHIARLRPDRGRLQHRGSTRPVLVCPGGTSRVDRSKRVLRSDSGVGGWALPVADVFGGSRAKAGQEPAASGPHQH